jgi:hypothetical protein
LDAEMQLLFITYPSNLLFIFSPSIKPLFDCKLIFNFNSQISFIIFSY